MLKKIGLIILALVLLACAGALVSRSRGTILPGLGAPSVDRLIEKPIASGDSMVVAKFAERRCLLLRGSAQRECFEEILLALVLRNRVRLAMTTLEVLSARVPQLVARGHDYTHVVGINAWSPGEDVGAVYEACTGLFQSGCYHGVVQAYLDANGADSAVVAGLCDLIPSAHTNMWLRFQCVHGLGHGLVQAKQLHLRRALEGCDWLFSSWDAESCYGGAFMEFIVAGRGQSHHPHGGHAESGDSTTAAVPATAGAEHADHGEHAHRAPAPTDTFAIRNRADPLYPCSVLAKRYQRSCYGMQAGIIIEITGADFGKIAQACDLAPIGMRPACYQGIGTYVSGFTVRDADKSIHHCMLGSPAHRAWCIVGVVKNFIDVTSLPADGLDFCRRLRDPDLGASCYVAVGEQIAVLKPAHPDRDRACAGADAAFREACRYGAGLPAQRPKNLPQFTPTLN
jgi:hypothetical protein